MTTPMRYLRARTRSATATAIPETGASAARFATTVVAASNSSEAGRAAADFVCDGTDDHEEINDALAGGGKVVLLEGTFSIPSLALIDVPAEVTLEGMGSDTIIAATSAWANSKSPLVSVNTDAAVRHLRIDGSNDAGGIALQGARARAEFLHIVNTERGVDITADDCRVTNSNILTTTGTDGHAIIIQNPGAFQAAPNGVRVQGNFISSATGMGVNAGLPFGKTSFRLQILDNHIITTTQHGIDLGGSEDCQIHGNVLSSCGGSVAWNGINIGSDAVDGSVQLNVVRGSGNYGIFTGGTNILIANNDLVTAGATGAFFDGGIGTDTLGGNRT